MHPDFALVRLRTLVGFNELVSAHGGDYRRLRRDVGIATDIDDPEASFPLSALCRLLTLAAEQLDLPDFGVQLASHQDLTILGTIALIAQSADTLEQAILGIGRNMPYHSPALHSELRRTQTLACLQVRHDADLAGEEKRQLAEYSMLNAINMVREIAQLPGADWRLRFTHMPGFELDRYQQIFGCEVEFGQAADQVEFPVGLLDLRIHSASPALREASERYVRSVIHRYPLDLARQIEEIARRLLGSGTCTLPMIAKQLGLAERSLQRRLDEQHISFAQIIDDLRRRRAEELLPLNDLPMTRIAQSLGYSSQTSFTRACRRWFGVTPREQRTRDVSAKSG